MLRGVVGVSEARLFGRTTDVTQATGTAVDSLRVRLLIVVWHSYRASLTSQYTDESIICGVPALYRDTFQVDGGSCDEHRRLLGTWQRRMVVGGLTGLWWLVSVYRYRLYCRVDSLQHAEHTCHVREVFGAWNLG